MKNRMLLNCFLGAAVSLAAVGANAACLSVVDTIPYTTIPAGQAVVGWGPKNVGNASCYAKVNATVNPDGNVYNPNLYIQKFTGGTWQTVSSSTYISVSASPGETPGQFRLLIENARYPGPIAVTGKVDRNAP